ncbi:hypothetical protein ACFE04_018075 [Oxalis oulophora]
MAVHIVKCIFIFFFLGLIAKGNEESGCRKEDIDIQQVRSTKTVKGNPVWEVIITNKCVSCRLENLRLGCRNLRSTEVIDPSKLVKSDDGGCLVNFGQPLFENSKLTFTYAWMTMYPFKPLDYEVECA